MARVRATLSYRGVTWLYKVYRNRDGSRGHVYEPKGAGMKPVFVDRKITSQQLGEILDGDSFEFVVEPEHDAIHL